MALSNSTPDRPADCANRLVPNDGEYHDLAVEVGPDGVVTRVQLDEREVAR